MKKILFVTDERKMGGVSVLLEDYLNNIDFKNNQVDVLVLHNAGDRLVNIPKNVNVIYGQDYFDIVDLHFKQLVNEKKYFKALKKLWFSFMIKTGLIKNYIQKVRLKLNISNYDVEVAFKDGFCTLFTAFGNSKKKINWVHSDYMVKGFTVDKYRNIFIKSFSKFDAIVALSQDIRKSFVTKYGHEDKLVIINNFLDDIRIKEMSEKDIDDVIKLDKTKINLVCVGRLCYQKSFDRLLDALNILKQENDLLENIHIDIIGDGEDKASLELKIKEFELENYVRLLGKKNNPYAYMKHYDAILLTSRAEAYCLVMVEALILKKPVITTEVASSHEILCDGKYGLITDNCADGIYKILKEVIQNKTILEEKKQNLLSYDYSEKNASIIKQVEALLEV